MNKCGHQVNFNWCGYLRKSNWNNKLVQFILCYYIVNNNYLGIQLKINNCGHQSKFNCCGYL